jgi:hypothetical protein
MTVDILERNSESLLVVKYENKVLSQFKLTTSVLFPYICIDVSHTLLFNRTDSCVANCRQQSRRPFRHSHLHSIYTVYIEMWEVSPNIINKQW